MQYLALFTALKRQEVNEMKTSEGEPAFGIIKGAFH